MTLETTNTMVSAPKWAAHRPGVAAADSVPITTLTVKHGVKADRFKYAIARARLASGTLTNLSLRPLFWNEVDEEFHPDPGEAARALNAEGQMNFEPKGRIFIIAVTILTGTSPVIDLDISGFGPAEEFD